MKHFRLLFVLIFAALLSSSCGVTYYGRYGNARVVAEPNVVYYDYNPYYSNYYYWDGRYWKPRVNVYVTPKHHHHHPMPPKPQYRRRDAPMKPHHSKPIPHHNQPHHRGR